MKRPLLFLFFVAYIAAAVYSVGRTSSGPPAFKASLQPQRATLNRVMLATGRMEAMVHFYNEVFAADLQPVEAEKAGSFACQQGTLSGVRLVLCPNQTAPQVAKARADQQRPQWRFAVSDLAEALHSVEKAGGKVPAQRDEQFGDQPVTVRDPDGNLIEFTQTNQ